MFLCFSQNLNYAIGWTVVHSLWQAFVITLIVGVALLLLQKKVAKTRYLMANIGLWAILAAALVTFTLYYDFSKQPGEFVFVPDVEENALTITKNGVDNSASIPQLNDASIRGMSWKGMKDYCNQNMYLIVTLWFIGVVIFVLRILGSISYVYYLKNRMNFPADEYWQETLDTMRERLQLTKYVDLVESALVRSPMVVGHLKPMILFPIGAINRLNSNEVEAILAHELAHVMRHDYLFNILQNVIEALFYFHPAVWWLSSQVRTERENCCDDVAISICGNAMTYAKSLVSVQEMAYYSPQLAMAFAGNKGKNQLLLRVQRILNQPKSTINMMEKIASTSVLLLVLVGFVFGGNRLDNNSILFDNNSFSSENTQNQNITNNKKSYLKYDNNGELDSLPVDKHVADGNYSFVNNLYDVDMTVKNQHVTAFKINGLDVDKKDMPKFQKMINELVSNRKEEEENGSEENTDNGDESYRNRIVMVDDAGVMSEMLTDKNGGSIILVHRGNQEPISISLGADKKTPIIGGKKANLKALEKLGWTVKNKALQPLKGMENMNIQVENKFDEAYGMYPPKAPPAPPKAPIGCVPPAPAAPNFNRRLDELRERSDDLRNQGVTALRVGEINRKIAEVRRDMARKGTNFNTIQGKIDDITGEIDDITAELDSSEDGANDSDDNNGNVGYYNGASSHDDGNGGSVRSAEHYDGEHKDATKFDAWLVSELKKDGYLTNTKTYNYAWNNRSMRVAGKTVSDAHRAKYLAMHKKMTGSDLGQSFSITKNVSEH
jgi:beta-lactamase regulating signal transducer with metallopeptidase domain